MHPSIPPALAIWQNFYVIAGTSAGALTGLQFVVIALIAQARAATGDREIRAFGTPTVTHFCTALLISILIAAPWTAVRSLGMCLSVCGGAGVLYSLRIIWHARKAAYNPDLEDWFWYSAMPVVAHLVLLSAALSLLWSTDWPLVAMAGDTLLFLLLGVRNAWDTVTYVALKQSQSRTGRDMD